MQCGGGSCSHPHVPGGEREDEDGEREEVGVVGAHAGACMGDDLEQALFDRRRGVGSLKLDLQGLEHLRSNGVRKQRSQTAFRRRSQMAFKWRAEDNLTRHEHWTEPMPLHNQRRKRTGAQLPASPTRLALVALRRLLPIDGVYGVGAVVV
jgi:hypothetical protein